MIEAIGTAFDIQMPFDILESAPSVSAISDFVAEKLQSSNRLPKSKTERKNSREKSTKIGVIATDFRFSGGVKSFEEFWDAMLTGRVVTGKMSEERKRQIGTKKEFLAGLLGQDISRFDGGFFGVSKEEAMLLDPQHRLLLHCAFNAWENAGMPQMTNADLFLAVTAHSEYRALAEKHVEQLDDRLLTGTNHIMMAGRLAQLLGVRGRALMVDSTCSSVASALELCMASMLRDGRDWGVVAATQLILSAPYMESLKSLLPPDYTKSFSVEASGFVRAEAVGVLILKRLEPEDHPLLVLDSALAIHSGAVVTPVVASVAKLVDECGPVDYIESHGTATAVGDGVEAMAYQTAGWEDILVASSKAQFGHSEAASGLLQMCKVAQVMEKGMVPAMIHNQLPNEHIRSNASLRLPFVNEEREVETSTIVSFGITGTKTAILTKKFEPNLLPPPSVVHILPISAKSKASLRRAVEGVAEMLRNTSYPLSEIASALQMRKSQHKWKAAAVAATHSEALNLLKDIVDRTVSPFAIIHVPLSTLSIHHASFQGSSPVFTENYLSFCDRLRFEPYSDDSSIRHCLAASFALLKLLISSEIEAEQYISHGPGALVLMAVFEVAAAHYVNDLLLAYLSDDIRQMKRITRDLQISVSAKLLNPKGEPMTSARQFVDACFMETADVLEPKGAIVVGGTAGPFSISLSTYRDFLDVLSSRYMLGSDVNWSQFGSSRPSIPLPEYPFDSRSHWIPISIPTEDTNKIVVDLDSEEWIHVRDHVINGEVIVPGATSLRVISQLEEGKWIESVDFLTPIRPTSSNKIVFSQNETSDGVRTLCADGGDAVSFSIRQPGIVTPSVARIDIPKKAMEKQAIYERLSLSALMYQQRFQLLHSLHASFGRGWASFSSVDHLDLLIDGALQAVAMGYLLEQPGDHHPWLPFNIDRVVILDKQPRKTGLSVNFTYKNKGDFLHGDVSIYDSDGRLVVDVKNVCFKRKEIEGRAAVPKTTVVKPHPVVKTSEAVREKAKSDLLRWFEDSFGWSDLDEKAGFFDLGLSSLQAVRFRNFIREQYPEASVTSVFDHPTIFDLSNYLASLDSDHTPEDEPVEEEASVPLEPSRLSQSPVGIRSAACRLPSGINDPAEFWQLLLIGKNASSRTPAARIPTRDTLIKGQKYGTPVDGGNFIEQDVAAFDPAFFKISKSEAEMMDPQQRLLLECVEECIENSGDMDMSEVGVFVGLMEKEYTDLMEQQQTSILSMLGSMVAVIAGRVNYVFGSYGPSVTVDTACSSSLVAVEMAVNALLDGRCRRAIVAGVNLILSEKGQGLRSNGKMLSNHGMSLSFDARASGYGRSDGCVVLMLEKAKPSTGYLATLGGVNVNHGGRSVSLTAPNGVAHKILLSSLLQSSPGMDVAVWEAHGTGTPLGDPIEVNTLSGLLSDTVISSAKAALGHGEASAGTCGLLKLAMTLKTDYVPALIHFHVLNKDIHTGSLRIPVVGEETAFEVGGISSFGVSGTNAAVLAKKDYAQQSQSSTLHPLYLVPLSAKNNHSLAVFQLAVEEVLIHSDEPIEDICGTLASRNHHMKRKALLVTRGRTVRELSSADKLTAKFCLGTDKLDFNLLALDGISENFELLSRFDMKEEDRLLVALLKFLRNVLPSLSWHSTSEKSQRLEEVATGPLKTNNFSGFSSSSTSATSFPPSNCISLGGDIIDLQSILSTLGRLFISGIDVDFTSVYNQPNRFIRLPTYPFNRQIVWFNEKPQVFEDALLGTEIKKDEGRVEFQNKLSELRHPSIFRNGFSLGTAVRAFSTAGKRFLGGSFKISEIAVEERKLTSAVWLNTAISQEKEGAAIIGKLDGKDIFKCSIHRFTAVRRETASLEVKCETVIFLSRVPSAVIKCGETLIEVDSGNECPYRTLFAIVEEAKEIWAILPLEKKFTIRKGEGQTEVFVEGGLVLVVYHEEMKKSMKEKQMVKGTPEDKRSVSEPEKSEGLKDLKDRKGKAEIDAPNIKRLLIQALLDVLTEEPDNTTVGFMEMGMDSLTLVDFVNRLNDKYFVGLEISTTDIFDNPSVEELAAFIERRDVEEKKTRLGKVSPKEILPEPVISTKAGDKKLEQTKLLVLQALSGVLTEEPEDTSIGFMEMGMDSLTLVDFVNRLNDKYFPGTDISTTDVFDNPSVVELANYIKTRTNGYCLQTTEISDNTAEQKEAYAGSQPTPLEVQTLDEPRGSKLSEFKTLVFQALSDVLTEEPQNTSVGFMEMGMDSLTLVDFVNRLNDKYFPSLGISTTDVFDNPSVEELAKWICSKGSEYPMDSGVGCSVEVSPIHRPVLQDAYFFSSEEETIKWQYKLKVRNGELVIQPADEATPFEFSSLSKKNIIQSESVILVELENSIQPEKLFLGLLEFVKLVVANKIKVTVSVPELPSSSQWMARAFIKTAAAEKPGVLKFNWTERLQRKRIQESELSGQIGGYWLITGGLAGIGLSTARWLVNDCGVSGVVLVSRRAPEGDLKKELEKISKRAVVEVISADLADKKSMTHNLNKLKFKIDGVVHCAGVIQDAKLERQSAATFSKVFNPKAVGYNVLDEVLTYLGHNPSSFIAMSSFTSACGNVGQLNYGISNAYLDFKMEERRREGRAGTSIHWGNWLETGMAANENIHRILSDYGFLGFTTDEGLQYLKYAILRKPVRIMAAKLNWDVILEKRKDIRRDLIKEGFLEDFLEGNYFQKKESLSSLVQENVNEAESNEREKDDDEDEEMFSTELISIAAKLLKCQPGKIKTNKNFMEMGFTSHTLATFLEEIFHKFGLKLTVAVFYEQPNIDSLADYLAALKQEDLPSENASEVKPFCDVFTVNIYYDKVEDFKNEVEKTISLLEGRIVTAKLSGEMMESVRGRSVEDLIKQLKSLQPTGDKPSNQKKKLVMMFPGQGAQYPLMGTQLAESFSYFKEMFHGCLSKADEYLKEPTSLLTILHENHKDLFLTSHMQPIMFSFCYALGKFWEHLGVRPDFYLGHSVGELVAGVMSGIMELEDGIRLIVARGKAMKKISGQGAMLAVDSRAVDDVLKRFDVSIAAVNSPKQAVLAGKKKILDDVLTFVKSKQLQATFVNVQYPFHSSLIQEEHLQDLRSVLKSINFKRAKTPVVSNVTSEIIFTFTEEYLVRHTVSAVMFVDCANRLSAEGVGIWLEAGPAGTLSQFLRRIVDVKENVILQSIQEKNDDCEKFIETAGALEKNGRSLTWQVIYNANQEEERLVEFPLRETLSLGSLEAAVVEDHCLKGEIVVPATFQMHSVLQTANKESTDNSYFTLNNIKFPSSWKPAESEETTLIRTLKNTVSIEAGGQKTCTGELRLQKTEFETKLKREDFERECLNDVDLEKFYRDNARNGLRYGPSFQVLHRMKRSENKAIAYGTVAENEYLWPLMDGALHCICPVVNHRRPDVYFVPVSLSYAYVAPSVAISKGQDVVFLSHLVAENEKFIQMHSCLLVDGRVLFETRNSVCVLFKADQVTIEVDQTNENCANQTNEEKDPESKNALQSSASASVKENVVVVGCDASFCFASSDVPSLWQQLKLGTVTHSYSNRRDRPHGVFLIDRDIAAWDPEFFGVSPKEAPFLDPQQRLLMVAVYRALEASSFPPLPSNTSIFIGSSGLDFMHRVYQERPSNMNGYLASGTHGSCLAGRLAYWLNVSGPAMVVDTACSSSATAIHLGCEEISNGRSDVVIVAGMNLILHDTITEVLKNAKMISPDGFCKTFDVSANGYQRSEGLAVVILASEKYSKRHNLQKMAEIANWALGHNGSSAALQVPNGSSQERTMRASGGTVEEVECHGTGTALGDPVEADAVMRVGSSRISSVKCHLGHSEAASGMASFIASVLQLENSYRIPQLHFSCPNQRIKFNKLSMAVAGEEFTDRSMRVNNFGFSGTNVSLVVKGVDSPQPTHTLRMFYLLPLSAKSKESLAQTIKEMKIFLAKSDKTLPEVASALQRRPQFRFRAIALVHFRRKFTLRFNQVPETTNFVDKVPPSLLQFSYGIGVVRDTSSVLTSLNLAHLPSPLSFHLQIASQFLSGESVSWRLYDDLGPPANLIPGYSFDNRRFWPFEEKEGIHKENIYYKKVLVEKPRKGKKRKRNVLKIDSSTATSTEIKNFKNGLIRFGPVNSSYEEAVLFCQLWNTVDSQNKVVIIVACQDNNTSFTEWTALLRSLASEKALPYLFVSYQYPKQLEDEILCLDTVDDVIFYKEEKRYAERIQHFSPSRNEVSCNHLVISGGGGGMGQAFIQKLQPSKVIDLSRSTGFDLSKPNIQLTFEADVVIHAAGVVDNGLHGSMTTERFRRTGDVKVNGLSNLLSIGRRSRIVALSSAAAVFGSIGQANYAFANGKMVSLAEKKGSPVQFIHFGPWKDVGMLAQNDLHEIRRQIEGGGWRFLETAVAAKALETKESVIVFDGDFEKILKRQPHLRNFLEDICLLETKEEDFVKEDYKNVREILEKISGCDFEDKENIPFMSLGMDSLMMEEVRQKISEHLQVSLSSAELYDNCTLELIENYILENKTSRKAKRVNQENAKFQERITPEDHSNAYISNEQQIGLTSSSSAAEVDNDNRVAIIGFSGEFSGAENIDQFWDSLLQGKESITRSSEVGPGFVSAAGVAPNVDHFDHKFFKVTKEEADSLDPQVRRFVQHAYLALENGGYAPKRKELRVAVFAGAEPSNYSQGEEEPVGSLQRMFRMNMKDHMATFTSHCLDLKGPAMAVYSACSSSILALQQGIHSIQLDESDLAIIGGASLVLPGQEQYEYQEGMVLSKGGVCRPFDKSADGTVRGSVVGCLLLKTYLKAKEDGDHILAVVESVGVSNDGAVKASFMAPNTTGQLSAMQNALRHVDKSRVGYVECHGTGTLVGDEIELKALRHAYRDRDLAVPIGSVKANIGHGFAGAGVAGIIKAIKMLETGKIPPQINFEEGIGALDDKFKVSKTITSLPQNSLIAVSAFGIGGTNGHVFLGLPPSNRRNATEKTGNEVFLPLSAASLASLDAQKEEIATFIKENPGRLQNAAATLQKREVFKHRSAICIKEEASNSLTLSSNYCSISGLTQENIAFFFFPQGLQYPGMGAEMMEEDCVFLRTMQYLIEIASKITKIDFYDVMYPSNPEDERIVRPDLAQIAVFITSMATVAQLSEWGIRGETLLGHSVGEYAALCLSGVFTPSEAIYLLHHRGTLCYRTPAAGMLAIRGELPELPQGVEVSTIFSEFFHCVIGPAADISDFKEKLQVQEIEFRELRTERGFHSYMLDGIMKDFSKVASSVHFKSPEQRVISSMNGGILKTVTETYLGQHLRKPVDLNSALTTLFSDEKIKVIVEVGPPGVLANLVKDRRPDIVCIGTLPRKNQSRSLRQTLADMWSIGLSVPIPKSYGQIDPAVPGYSFEGTVCWKERLADGNGDHRFFSTSWIPLPTKEHMERTHKLLVVGNAAEYLCLNPEDIDSWENPTDMVVYLPNEQDPVDIYFTTKRICDNLTKWKAKRFIVVSSGNPIDWIALGPIREFHLISERMCSFVENSEDIPLNIVIERVYPTAEDCLLMTKNNMMKLAFSEISPSSQEKIGGVVVIIGGGGSLGKAYVSLLKNLPEVKVICILGRTYSSVENSYICDVTEKKSVFGTLDQIRERFGTIDALVQLAGKATSPSLHKKISEVKAVMAPKVQGTQNILAYLEERNLHLPRLICSGSLSSFLPLQGADDYASANSFLDGLALKGHPRVGVITTVQWPLWKEGGMSSKVGGEVGRILSRGAISNAKGIKGIRDSLCISGCSAYSLLPPIHLKDLLEKAQLTSEMPTLATQNDGRRYGMVLGAWKGALCCEVTENTNFFDAGGNSLNALRVIWQINNNIGLKLSVNFVFSNPVFSNFYSNLPLEQEQKQKWVFNPTQTIPLSFAQENMYLLRMLEPGPQYNIVFALTFPSSLDRKRMVHGVMTLIARQRGLRTIFPSSMRQEVLSLTEAFHCQAITNRDYEETLLLDKNTVFDFNTVPLRIRWFGTDKGLHLMFNQHHILTDGWSMTVLAKELSTIYNQGLCENLDESVAAFSLNDRQRNVKEGLDQLKSKLQNSTSTSLLPDKSRVQGTKTTYRKLERFVPLRVVENIKRLAKIHRTTEFVVSLAAFALTIRRWKQEIDEDSVVVGVPVSGRNELSEELIGFFLNNMVLSLQVDEEKALEDLIASVKANVAESRKWEDVPFHLLVADMGIEREIGKHPLFQLYFNYRHSLDYPKVEIEGMDCKVRQVSMNTLFDLSTTMDETPEGMRVTVEYNSSLYFKETVELILNDFMGVLANGSCRSTIRHGPKVNVPIGGLDEILRKSGTPRHYPKIHPEKIGYHLEQKMFKEFGIGQRGDTLVILDLDPNTTALLIPEVICAGFGYAPMDPAWPEERKQIILQNLHHSLVLDYVELQNSRKGKGSHWIRSNGSDTAYVIHTSGSTGVPKGVVVSQSNVLNFLLGSSNQMYFNKESNVFNSVNTVFDVSVSNIIAAAVYNSTLVFQKDLMNQVSEASDCSYVFLTSAVFNSLTRDQLRSLRSIEKLFVGGESVQERNLVIALEMGIDVTQIYGPTEGTIWSLTNRCKLLPNEGRVIGKPMANENVRIDGEIGELVLEGAKVARGYLASAGFVRRYGTKDFVKRKGEKFIYLGRLDGQIKIRGNRVELGEIEAHLQEITGAIQVTILQEESSLVAFLVGCKAWDNQLLKDSLSKRLPSYCIPVAFVFLVRIPRNSSGKTDKERLLQEFHRQLRVPNQDSGEQRQMVNSIEERMTAVFGSVLKREVDGIEADFYSLGGHSLLLLKLQTSIKEEFNVEISVSDLFIHPTVAGTAQLVVEKLRPSLKVTNTGLITRLREAENPKFNVYLTHAIGGTIFPYYAFLSIFPKDVSVYAIEFQLEYPAETLKELAALYAKTIAAHTNTVRPFVVGHSMGGSISREMIPDLKMWGWEVPFVVMFDSWVLRPNQLSVDKIRSFMETVFAPLPNAAVRVARAVKLGDMLRKHKVTKSNTKMYLFKSCELGVAAFREAVKPDLNEELSRSLIANGFDRASHQPVTTWLINGDHESCLKLENLKTRQMEILGIFKEYF